MLSKRVIKNERKTLQYLNHKIAYIIARFILGGVFIYASIDKISFPKEFTNIVTNYHLLPPKVAACIAFILPWVEIILGIFLISGIFVRESAYALSILLIIFMIVLGIRSFYVPFEDCGCFAKTSILSSSSLLFVMTRDLIFLGLGIFIIISKDKNAFNSIKTGKINESY